MGGIETPEPLVVARVPGVNVPVCVMKGVSETPCASGVVASVPECVLPSTPCVKGAPQAEEAAGAKETAGVCEAPCVSGTTGVSERVCVSETPRVSAPRV